MITLENVGLMIRRTKILEEVSFSVGKGEFVFLAGSSGAGKSSILKLIHFFLYPTVGTVLVEGLDTRKVPKWKIPYLRRSIGFIFQDYKLLRDKTAFENVAFALEVTGGKKKSIMQKTNQALHTVGMTHRLNHYPRDLSGGECQRVAIARAIVREPVILLADEPTGNLDDENAVSILRLLEKINCSGTAVLMATHKTGFIQSTPVRTITLEGGRIRECRP
jgi:cell division transport system ATP-binding protein